jgi:PAS domain S-box-containing protein
MAIKYLILIVTDLTEHKQQTLILKSEWFSRIILEQAANIILVTDPYGNVLRTNILAIEIMEKQEKFLSPNWHIDMFLKNFRLVLSNEELNNLKIKPVDFSLLLSKKIKNGSEVELFNGEIIRNFLISYNTIKENKQKLGYSISLTDITELKKAEKKLVESEEKYRSLFESMSQPFLLGKIIFDYKRKPVDFIYLEVNKAWEEVMGFSKSKIIGKRAYEIFPNLDPNWLKMFGKTTLKSKPINFKQFGSLTNKWFNVIAYPQKNECFAVILEDITQHKNQEEKIFSLSKFPSEDPNPVLRVDKNLKIIYSNKSGKKILNSLGATGSLIPKKLAEFTAESLKKDKNNFIISELKIGKSFYEFSIIPVKESNYFNIYGRDITEIKKAEKIKIRTLQDKILQMERKRIARELHDSVSQNLFSSSLLSESISKSWGKDPKSALKNLEIIRGLNSSALSEIRILITNMMPERITNTTLKDLIERLLNNIENQSGIKTDMIFEADHDINKKVKNEVYYIVKESLNNVAKHSEATSVKVIIELNHNKLKIVISDNGKGFDLKNNSEKRKFGLNIMKERAKSIGASLKVNSAPGEGATITLLKKK